MSIREIFGTRAWWVLVALIFMANVFAVFMFNVGREWEFLIISDVISLLAYIIAVWLGTQKMVW